MKQYSPARLTQAAAAQARQPSAARGEFDRDRVGRGARDARGAPRDDPRHRSEAVRALHRPRPDAGADRPVRAAVRHAQLRGARRLLLGQHGGRDDLHDRRLVLGVRRPRPRPREAVRDDRHGRGPSLAIRSRSRSRKFKRDGGRFISINPVRTGYSAIADEWVPIRPGTDGALLLALDPRAHRATGSIDRAFLARYTNARAARRCSTPATRDDGLFARDADAASPLGDGDDRKQLWWDASIGGRRTSRRDPALYGEFTLPDGRAASKPVAISSLRRALARRALHAGVGGRDHRHSGGDDPPARARDGRHRASTQTIELPIPWTDAWGREHDTRHRQPGGVPRDARPRRALERLPDRPRARDPDERCSARSTGPAASAHKAPYPRRMCRRRRSRRTTRDDRRSRTRR